MDFAQRILVVSGLAAILIGFFCGFPLRRAITREQGEEAVRGWRVAHSSLVNGGVMLLAIAGVFGLLELSEALAQLVAVSLAASLVAFSYALVLGAARGHRGLEATGDAIGRSLYYGNTLGALLSTIGLLGALAGAVLGLAGAR
jgi:hypothetical protein